MRAIVHREFGEPAEALQVEDVARPRAEGDQVLVGVHSAAVAKGDWLTATGLPYIARPIYGIRRPRHQIAGLELAGTVEEVGDGVTDFAPGDQVLGWGNGTLADYVALPESQLVKKPADLPFPQAAAIPVSGVAALQAVRDAGEVTSGDSVLIIGASGGVGSFAVQIAKALGATVTGVASSRNLELVRALGADRVIDYARERIGAGGERFDVIVDIAGNRSLRELRRALQPRGTLVIVGGSGGRMAMGFGRTVRAQLLSPFVGQRLRGVISRPNADDLGTLTEMAAAGNLTPHVGGVYPLAQAAIAIDLVGRGQSHGKTVIAVSV